MNELMGGMKHNKDIINADLATEEEVEAFIEGTGDGPDLDPMRPHFGKNMLNAWNNALAERFLDYLVEKYDFEPLTKQEAKTIRSRFEDRLHSLKREWQELTKKKPADFLEKKKAKAKKMRAASRRDRVCVLISSRIHVIDFS